MTFYVIENPTSKQDIKKCQVTDFNKEDANRGEAPKCAVCKGAVGMRVWLPPYKAELEVWGKEYGDIAFGPGNELLVSERFVTLYKAEGLRGLGGFNEVKIIKVIRRGGSKLRTPPPRYYCVTIVRSRTAIDIQASGLIMKGNVCQECRLGHLVKIDRVVIEENTWSGEDIFFARGLAGDILTSERFKEFFERHRINNGILIEADKFSIDYSWVEDH